MSRRLTRLRAKPGYHPAAISLFSRMSSLGEEPDSTRKAIISDFFKAEDSNGDPDDPDFVGHNLSLYDCLWMIGATSAASRLNMIKAAHDLTTTNALTSPTFTSDRGWTGNGSDMRFITNFTPSVHGVKFTARVASFGVWIRSGADTSTDMGGAMSGQGTQGAFRLGANNGVARINSNDTINFTVPDALGFHVIKRIINPLNDAMDEVQYWHNGVLIATENQMQGTITAVLQYIFCLNNNGSLSSFSNEQYAGMFYGSGDIDVAAQYTNWQDTLQAIGAV